MEFKKGGSLDMKFEELNITGLSSGVNQHNIEKREGRKQRVVPVIGDKLLYHMAEADPTAVNAIITRTENQIQDWCGQDGESIDIARRWTPHRRSMGSKI